jgi:hypothetical protein
LIYESNYVTDEKGVYTYQKMKNRKYHTVGTVPTSNRKTSEKGKLDTPNTHIHDDKMAAAAVSKHGSKYQFW